MGAGYLVNHSCFFSPKKQPQILNPNGPDSLSSCEGIAIQVFTASMFFIALSPEFPLNNPLSSVHSVVFLAQSSKHFPTPPNQHRFITTTPLVVWVSVLLPLQCCDKVTRSTTGEDRALWLTLQGHHASLRKVQGATPGRNLGQEFWKNSTSCPAHCLKLS